MIWTHVQTVSSMSILTVISALQTTSAVTVNCIKCNGNNDGDRVILCVIVSCNILVYSWCKDTSVTIAYDYRAYTCVLKDRIKHLINKSSTSIL